MKVLLIGDNCIDRYVYGNVNRISPEAPVPVFECKSEENKAGMAANVKENLLAFGASVDIITPKEYCLKTRYVDIKTKYQIMRADQDYNLKAGPIEVGDLSQYDSIVISDYNKGFVSYDTIEYLRDNFNGPMFMDTKKQQLGKFHNIYIKINEREYNDATSLPLSSHLIVTKGSKGAEYYNKLYPAENTDVFDVTGAGDTFLAALTVKYLLTDSIPKAIEFANKCAAITVRHPGVYVPTQQDLLNLK